MTRKLKIAIVVHGRFHAFDLTRELIKQGHEVKLFTNFPKWAVARFGVSSKNVSSCWPEGVASRIALRTSRNGLGHNSEVWLHRWFGRWAATNVTKEDWDVVLCWSGVAQETFLAMQRRRSLLVCHRSSAHIRTQARLLSEEYARTGLPQECPSPWMIAREMKEYGLADLVYVPSDFSQQSFAAEGEEISKVVSIPHGVETRMFRPTLEEVEARCARIRSGAPLQIINVGTFSFQKGMWDLAEVIKDLKNENFRFRFVGPVKPEASTLVAELQSLADFVPTKPQSELPSYYRQGDIFVLPTIQDGFPFVLAQASAACLPILTTPNGAGYDLVNEGQNGWVVPIRNQEAIKEKLRGCDAHREEVAQMVKNMYQGYQARDWSEVARDFESICMRRINPEIESRIEYVS